MQILETQDFDFRTLDAEQNDWVYNMLDCSVTAECWREMKSTVAPYTLPSYDFVRAMQGPAMTMALRGIKINLHRRSEWIRRLELDIQKYQARLDRMAQAVWGQDLNPNSPQQLKKFFYEVLALPPQHKYDKVKKERTLTTDRNALEALRQYYPATPICNHILRIRELIKRVGTLKTGIDLDGRMRTSYNVAGTETGRWSSNKNAFGTGTNLQNWTNELREIFEADPGMKWGYFDGAQAESRVVGYLSGDEAYISACESGDLHTAVAKMVWPELPWTGDLAQDKLVAETKFYRDFSYRDFAKKLGHGTNYYGKPRTMAMHAKLEVRIVEEFQEKYFAAFPGIRRWHHEVALELQTKGFLTTPLGRTRYFLGRLFEDETLKEGIAFLPQSTVAEVINEGVYRVWEKLEINLGLTRTMAQLHDAGLFMWHDRGSAQDSAMIKLICQTMTVPVPIGSRTLVIPISCEGIGWNWRKFHPQHNPEGLKAFNGSDTRKRKVQDSSVLSRFYL